MKGKRMNAEQLAKKFHETYEELAPQFGYKTREASAKPWEVDFIEDMDKRVLDFTTAQIEKIYEIYDERC